MKNEKNQTIKEQNILQPTSTYFILLPTQFTNDKNRALVTCFPPIWCVIMKYRFGKYSYVIYIINIVIMYVVTTA